MYFFARSAHPPKYQLTRLMNFTLPSITCSHNGLLQVLIRGGVVKHGRRREADPRTQRRVYVTDLQVIERNGDICIDFANIGFVNGDTGGMKGRAGRGRRGRENINWIDDIRLLRACSTGKMSQSSQSAGINDCYVRESINFGISMEFCQQMQTPFCCKAHQLINDKVFFFS